MGGQLVRTIRGCRRAWEAADRSYEGQVGDALRQVGSTARPLILRVERTTPPL